MRFRALMRSRGSKKNVLVCSLLGFLLLVWNKDSLISRAIPFNLTQVKLFSPREVYDIAYHYKNSVGFRQFNSSNCQGAFDSQVKNKDFPQKVQRISDDQFVSVASKDCKKFRHFHGFPRYPAPSEEEEKFPLAFILLFHKDIDQVLYLLRAIYHPHNVYCLSVDMNAGQKFLENVRTIVKCIPNVFVSSELRSIVYAGFSRLEADINCMKDLLKSSVSWRYVINMAGQEFPLRTNLEIVRILSLYNNTNDVEGIGGRRMLPMRFKFKHKYVHDNKTGRTRLVKTNIENPPPPHGLEVVKGSTYGSFSRPFVDFVIHSQVARDLLEWSKAVSSPDEYFWATLHHSKTIPVPGRYTGPLEKKKWISAFAAWGGENPCATLFVRAVCIFSPQDLPLLNTRKELFANKFYITHHPGALHCLDQQIYNLTISKTVRDLSFYRQNVLYNDKSKSTVLTS